MKKHIFTILLVFSIETAFGQQIISLYEGATPNNKPCSRQEKIQETGSGIKLCVNVNEPTLAIYTPDKQDQFKTSIDRKSVV